MKRITPIVVLRLAAIGAVLLTLTAGFAFAAGWLSPDRLRPQDIVEFPADPRRPAPGLPACPRQGALHRGDLPGQRQRNGTFQGRGFHTRQRPRDRPALDRRRPALCPRRASRLPRHRAQPDPGERRAVADGDGRHADLRRRHAAGLPRLPARHRARSPDRPARPCANGGFPCPSSRDARLHGMDARRAIAVELRQRHLLQHQRLPLHRCGRRDPACPLVAGARDALRGARQEHAREPAAGLPVRRRRPAPAPRAAALAHDRHCRRAGRPGRRRHQALAGRPPAGRCRHAHDRSRHDRGGRCLPQYHIRSIDPAGRHGVLGRSAAGGALGRLFRLPDATGRRAGSAECRFEDPAIRGPRK